MDTKKQKPRGTKFSVLNQLKSARDMGEVVAAFRESPALNRWGKRLPGLLTLSFVLLGAYAAATLTWQILPKPALSIPSTGKTIVSVKRKANSSLPSHPASDIANWKLFGELEKASAVKPVTKKIVALDKIKETTLSVNLIGIVFSKHEHESRAIILGGPKNAKAHNLYKVNDQVAPSAKITRILRDQIILIHNNEQVSLKLRSVKETEKLLKKYSIDIKELKKETARKDDTLR